MPSAPILDSASGMSARSPGLRASIPTAIFSGGAMLACSRRTNSGSRSAGRLSTQS